MGLIYPAVSGDAGSSYPIIRSSVILGRLAPGEGQIEELTTQDVCSFLGLGAASFLSWELATQSMVMQPRTGYVVDALSLIVLRLPSTANPGDKVAVLGQNDARWRISQGEGQYILAGDRSSTAGVTGKLESLDSSDQVELMCLSPECWRVLNCYGNLEIL